MTTATKRSISISLPASRPGSGEFDLPARRIRRRSLDVLRALDAVGEPCTYRVVTPNGTAVPSDQDIDDVVHDLEEVAAMKPPPPAPANEQAAHRGALPPLRGLLRDLGPAPSEDSIDEARRELWGGLPRGDLP